MGPGIHPRLKKPVGQRLAAGALALAYGFAGPVTGPTISGCSVAGAALTISFNAMLLAGAPLAVAASANSNATMSALSVLIGSDGTPDSGHWVAVTISLQSGTTVVADLAPLSGSAPQAIKYAWGATGGKPNDADVVCCPADASGECVPGMCPISVAQKAAFGGALPANPFLAQITAGGKCACPPPQVCDA